jgi:hypothetical protein
MQRGIDDLQRIMGDLENVPPTRLLVSKRNTPFGQSKRRGMADMPLAARGMVSGIDASGWFDARLKSQINQVH